MPKHASQDALGEQTFERLLQVSNGLKEPYDLECRFVLLVAGRLGLRAGELCHIRESWIDWDREAIRIPQWDSCDFGRDGGPCGYCQKRAEQHAESTGATYEEAIKQRWEPKTPTSVRTVPFGFSRRVADVLEEFFFHRDAWQRSRSSINRRVDRVLEAAGMPTDAVYPHSLRATASTYHAYQGLSVAALQAMFGWAQLSTAQKYVRLSGGATEQALQKTHGG